MGFARWSVGALAVVAALSAFPGTTLASPIDAATHVAQPAAIYQFRVSLQGRYVLDEHFDPVYASGRCEPDTGITSTLAFTRPATTGARADLYYVVPRMLKGFVPEEGQAQGPATATFSQVNTYGPPMPNCTDTAPPPDCSATPHRLAGLHVFLLMTVRSQFSFYAQPGGSTRPPFKTCFPDRQSVFPADSVSSARLIAELKNPRLERFTFGRTVPVSGSYGSGAGTLTWKATFTRIRRCPYRAGELQTACLRGLR
jgi:hypothetical protein